MNTLLQRIFRRRQFLGLRDQEPHRKDLILLARLLKTKQIPHPYCSEGWNSIKTEEAFSNIASQGPKGPLLALDSASGPAYLYRLHRLDQMEWLPFLSEHLGAITKIGSRLREEFERRRLTWLPLSDYSLGTIQSRRHFSWWTTLIPPSLSSVSLASWIRDLGIPADSLRYHMAVLRLNLARISAEVVTHIPSSLDGFDSPIYHPQPYRSPLRPGITISLNEFPNILALGAEELTLGPVPVNILDFSLVNNLIVNHGVPLSTTLFELLATYYEEL